MHTLVIAQYYNKIGLLHWENRELEKSIRYYKEALDINPNYVIAWSNLGRCYLDTGQYGLAFTALSKAKELGVDNKKILNSIDWLRYILEI